MRRLLALIAALALLSPAAPAEPLALDATPIERFGLGDGPDSEGDRPLAFLGGLVLSSPNRDFGAISGIDMEGAGAALMVGDTGTFVRATLRHEAGRLVGIADAEIGDIFPQGATSKEKGDVEDVTLDPADLSRGVIVRERQANAMLSFRLVDGRPTDFQPQRVGAPDGLLQSNRGLESVAYAPAASLVAGRIVAVAERGRALDGGIPGWIVGEGEFQITRRDEFDISSARFLPDGDLVLLERRFDPPFGLYLRLRRIPGAALAVGATLDGEVLLDANLSSQIDNMEGLAVSEDDAGRVILTLVSDDNFNLLQRTLLLQFELITDQTR